MDKTITSLFTYQPSQPTHSLLPRIISDSLKTNDFPQSKTLKSLRMSTTKQEAFSVALFVGLDYATRVSVLKKIALMQPREPQTPPNYLTPHILSLTEQHQSSLASLVMATSTR